MSSSSTGLEGGACNRRPLLLEVPLELLFVGAELGVVGLCVLFFEEVDEEELLAPFFVAAGFGVGDLGFLFFGEVDKDSLLGCSRLAP